jgi:hypothetical protein
MAAGGVFEASTCPYFTPIALFSTVISGYGVTHAVAKLGAATATNRSAGNRPREARFKGMVSIHQE